MKKFAIIHYLPLEYYPPAINFLDFLPSQVPVGTKIFVYTTANVKGRLPYQNRKVQIRRFPFPKEKEHVIFRLFKYFFFNIGTLFRLLWNKPEAILYYESYSAWPVYWFIRLRGKNCKLLIHYHEYSSIEWYEKGMKTVKNYYEKEKSLLWKSADWISHTNKERISLFQKDYPFITSKVLQVVPNYPPKDWERYKVKTKSADKNVKPLRTVYVGSLSLSATYLKEYCEWVKSCYGQLTFTIYSYNLDKETITYLNNLNCPFIQFLNEGIDYKNIPKVINDYHVGIIFYKPYSDNVVHCAPNKFYEYFACGLDVWYPKDILGMKLYRSEVREQKVLEIDFQNLKKYEPTTLYERPGHGELKSAYFCEEVYEKLARELHE